MAVADLTPRIDLRLVPGRLAVDVVTEFLQFFKLAFTESVLLPEANIVRSLDSERAIFSPGDYICIPEISNHLSGDCYRSWG